MKKVAGYLLCLVGMIAAIWLYNFLSADKWALEDSGRREVALEKALARQELVRRRSALNEVFDGKCRDRCDGHVAGYEWAFRNEVTDFRSCRNQSRSFEEGCQAAVPDVRAVAYNLSRNPIN